MYLTMGPVAEDDTPASREASIARWRKAPTEEQPIPNVEWEDGMPAATLSGLGRRLLGLEPW